MRLAHEFTPIRTGGITGCDRALIRIGVFRSGLLRDCASQGRGPDWLIRTGTVEDRAGNRHFGCVDSYYRLRSSRLCTASRTIRRCRAVNKIFTPASYAERYKSALTTTCFSKINALIKLHKKQAGWLKGRQPLGPRHFSGGLFTDLSTGNGDYR